MGRWSRRGHFVASYFGYQKPQRTVNAVHMIMDFASGEIR
jgi:hypothetical protein